MGGVLWAAFDFGLNLKNIREEKGLTIAVAAKRIGRHRTTLQNYENNLIQPSLGNLEKLADLYGRDINRLLGRKGYKMDMLDVTGLDAEERKIIQMIMDKFRENK